MRLCDKEASLLGLGTWGMGGGFWSPDYSRDEVYVNAIRYAYERGIRVFDTAEMYGGGHTEELVGRALADVADDVIIISKVWPNHFHYDDLVRSAEASRRRLGVKSIDIYLLHWPSRDVPLQESIRALEDLVDRGVIRCMGVSNFDRQLLEEAMSLARRHEVVVDEVEYSVYNKWAERDLIPFARQAGVTIVAYSPLGRGSASSDSRLARVGAKYGKTPVQVALNYLMRSSLPIPKASRKEHIDELLGAVGWSLSDEDYNYIRSL
ncbi:aldo/keto reductase [Acidilobus sp.]|uniref:aldo/keto reductase n=1 Tax=Acidilobus sp. TaxID=1872109 RepID=UPI003D04B19F